MQNFKLFFSYSEEDISIIKRIYDNLSSEAILNIWFDKTNITDGDELKRVISKGINNEVDYFIIFISKNSINSEWVKFELECAITAVHLK